MILLIIIIIMITIIIIMIIIIIIIIIIMIMIIIMIIMIIIIIIIMMIIIIVIIMINEGLQKVERWNINNFDGSKCRWEKAIEIKFSHQIDFVIKFYRQGKKFCLNR